MPVPRGERAISLALAGDPNVFGATYSRRRGRRSGMDDDDLDAAVGRTDAPQDRPREVLTVADAPPPEPLTATLETLADLDDDVVLVQVNDRVPRHLFPKLADRGYVHDSTEVGDRVVTAVWPG
jgi:hypothetical protein